MTKKEYDNFCNKLQKRGYKKYPSPRFKRDEYAWFKSFGESEYEEDRGNYQICFDVFDFSEYATREPHFIENPFSIEPQILVSRTIDERVDLHLCYTGYEDTDIDNIEKVGESFFKWCEVNMKIKERKK
jgi:hypothetical protein